jgi:hypothetical protein
MLMYPDDRVLVTTRPVFLLPLASDSRYRADPQGSLLSYWLAFDQVGLSPTG